MISFHSRENICKKPKNSDGGCDALGLAEIGKTGKKMIQSLCI